MKRNNQLHNSFESLTLQFYGRTKKYVLFGSFRGIKVAIGAMCNSCSYFFNSNLVLSGMDYGQSIFVNE